MTEGGSPLLSSFFLPRLTFSPRALVSPHLFWPDKRTRFEPLADNSGRLRCCYTKPGGRKEREECVTDIPCFLLKAILKQIATEGDEEQVQNLRPVSMALVSPRVFWSLVRHGGVGPGVSFAAALGNLVPSVDWNALVEQRKRARPEKYGDYVSH